MARRIPPKPGQESVWDYPRPAVMEPTPERLRVVFAGQTVADSTKGYRVLETSHPPTYYIPKSDFAPGVLQHAPGRSTFCEWKGRAEYYDLVVDGKVAKAAAWTYPNPTASFAELVDCFAVYASRVDACMVGDEEVERQEGDFYGGWITSKVVGPFKGAPGTWGW